MAWQDSAPMARKQFTSIYIGPWLVRLGRKPREVALKVGMNEGYLSQLISGGKFNPSAKLMVKIAAELGISVNALYSPPPSESVADRVKNLRPDQLEALGAFLDGLDRPPTPKHPSGTKTRQ